MAGTATPDIRGHGYFITKDFTLQLSDQSGTLEGDALPLLVPPAVTRMIMMGAGVQDEPSPHLEQRPGAGPAGDTVGREETRSRLASHYIVIAAGGGSRGGLWRTLRVATQPFRLTCVNRYLM